MSSFVKFMKYPNPIPNRRILSQKWTLCPYGFAILHVFGYGFEFFLSDRAYGTGPGDDIPSHEYARRPTGLYVAGK